MQSRTNWLGRKCRILITGLPVSFHRLTAEAAGNTEVKRSKENEYFLGVPGGLGGSLERDFPEIREEAKKKGDAEFSISRH